MSSGHSFQSLHAQKNSKLFYGIRYMSSRTDSINRDSDKNSLQ